MNSKFRFIIIALLGFILSCAQVKKDTLSAEDHAYTNALINEKSPYLIQHAHNPVNWHPWGDEAIKKAKEEGKMLIISVGYSACHWCHVMEHESFEDTAVANLMNKHFVSIKVDREERPDVDQVYMNAAQLINGSGGWPLNAIALSNGKPFYAGTYYPKEDWMKLLNYFVSMKESNPDKIIEQAENITHGIDLTDNTKLISTMQKFSIENLNRSVSELQPTIDYSKGGRKRAPKFPMPSFWEALLEYNDVADNEESLEAVNATLESMANGGIYDHVGGGFARYSTDVDWKVPHFEKMLYDNAQLVSLYTHAWQVTKNPMYKEVVYETLSFVERELTDPNGGFYSSLDADSDGEEGKFYVWKKKEIDGILGENAKIFNEFYNVKSVGNWEHGNNILYKTTSKTSFAEENNMSVSELTDILNKANNKLLDHRDSRIRPGLDDKVLTSWNALMLKGYIQAYRAFGEEHFLDVALKNAAFLEKNTINKQFELSRNYKDGKAGIHAFLDDYAFLSSAYIELYQATFDEEWLNKAHSITQYAEKHFFDIESKMFFYTNDQYSNLIVRKKEVADNVIPASNSEMARNLFVLGHYFYNEKFISTAKQMLNNVLMDVHENPYYYSNWMRLELMMINDPFEVAIVGSQSKKIRAEIDKNYLPHVLFLGGKKEGHLKLLQGKNISGQTTIFVCKNKTCNLPVTKIEDVLPQLK